MKRRTKIISAIIFSFVMLVSILGVACASSGEFKFNRTLPTQVTYGNEIHFREYIPFEYGAEYELYVSYYDAKEQKQITDEKRDSLVFRFEEVTDYSFTIKRITGGNAELKCEIACYPELPKFDAFAEYSTFIGDSLTLNDLLFWCNVNVINDATVDVGYKYEFVNAVVKSSSVDGSDSIIDLSSKNVFDTFSFDYSAVYEFNLNAINRKGSVPITLTANTTNKSYHSDELLGYVYTADDTIEFSMSHVKDEDKPQDGAEFPIRLGTTKGTAVYDAQSEKYLVNDFDSEITVGQPERLYVDLGNADYSLLVVAPDLVITQENIRELETVTKGYVVLREDIDMSLIKYDNENGRNYWGGARTGSYDDHRFMGTFDGQDHTIKNFTTGSLSYSGGIFYSVGSSAIIKNVNFEKANVVGWNSVVAGRTASKARFENIAVEVASMATTNSSIIVGPTETDVSLKNILIYVASLNSSTIKGSSFLGGFYASSIVASNVFCISDTELPLTPEHISINTSIIGSANKLTRAEVLGGEGVVGLNDMPTLLLKQAFDKLFINYAVKLNSENIGLLQTATTEEFWLTEDIDFAEAFDGAWNPTSEFVGVLDGKGYTIKNFTANNLFNKLNGAKIIDINFIDINFTGTKGFIVANNVSAGVTIENSIFTFTQFGKDNGSWASLVGYLTGGVANLKNVFIDAPVSTNARMGMITCHAGTGYALENVYMVGGNGSIHSTTSENNVNYTYDNETYGKGLVGTLDEDYFFFGTREAIVLGGYELPENIQNAIDTGVLEINVVDITKDNVTLLQTATTGYYKLVEDIDMADVEWTPSATFTGILDGQGHTISNLTCANLFNGFAGEIKDVNFINVKFTGNKGFLSNVNVSSEIKVENAIFAFAQFGKDSGSWAALVGYLTGGVANLKNVYIEAPVSTNTRMGMISCNSGSGYVLENVYMVGGNGSIHSTDSANNVNYTYDNETYGKGLVGTLDEDYFFFGTKEAIVLGGYELPSNIQNAIDTGILEINVVDISKDNVSLLQAATTGYYRLTEDIDMTDVAWTPSATFTGILDGQGHTISNLTCANLFNGFAGEIKDVNFINVKFTGTKGFLSSANVSSEIKVENAIFTFAQFGKDSGSWASLAGYLTGGVANLKNVYIEAPSSANTRMGMISCHAGSGYVLENVYMVGGNGSIHSTTSENNANYTYDNPSYGKGLVGTLNEDYFFLKVKEEIVLNGYELPENIQSALDNELIKINITKLNKENISTLATATVGYFALTEDIDMAGVAWTPSGTFAGVLDGQGHSISNLTCASLFSGFAGEIKNANFINVKFTGTKGFLSSANVSSEIKVENAIFAFAQFGKDSGSWASLAGYLTGGVANLKNVYIEAPASTNTRMGMISCHAGTGYVLENVYMVGGSGSIHSTDSGNNANYKHDNPTYGKGLVGTLNEDYFFLSVKEEIALNGYELPENIQSALDNELIKINITKLNEDNISTLASATAGYFVLAEDIDMTGVTWTPSSFSGVLDGQGYTISNFSGTSFFTNSAGAVIRNINFIDATFTSDGFFAPGNGARTATLENCVLTFTQFGKDSGSWAALFGGQTGGILTLNNVYIEIPVTTNDRLGAITKVAETGSKLTNVYLVGGNGSVHSTNSSNNATFVRTNPTYAPNFVGEATIFTTTADMIASFNGNVPEFLKEYVESISAE